jgi:hypothetical protein
MTSIKNCFEKWGWEVRKINRGVVFGQSTLYACMEVQQWNLFVQLLYTNKKN